MKVSEILTQVGKTQGTNAKLDILRANGDNLLLQKALRYSLDTAIVFNITKVSKVTNRRPWPLDEQTAWDRFFEVADDCRIGLVSGNAAIAAFQSVFSGTSVEDEYWMRRVLQKKTATGLARTTTNTVFPGLISTFKVQLADKWDEKTAKKMPKSVFIEPKLDGIRLLATVEGGTCNMFARSGKAITNFDDTIGAQLAKLPDGVYDGEIMDENFTALMRQVRRQTDADVSSSYLALFDYVTPEDWKNQNGTVSMRGRRLFLESIFANNTFTGIVLIEQKEIPCTAEAVAAEQVAWESQGFEGAMVKSPDAVYKFGRSKHVLKCKSFFDADVPVTGFREGTEKLAGNLGSLFVDFNGVEVNVGSGFSDEQRAEIWNNQDKYLGMIAECRYQEITPDGSLRFPTFVCWRLDK
jgi:DNA ligase 1